MLRFRDIAIVLLAILPTALFGAEVKVCDVFARPGTTGELSIAVFDVFDLAGADVALGFDSTLLSANAVTMGALLVSSSQEFLIASNLDPCPEGEDCPDPEPGSARLSFAAAQGIGTAFGVVANVSVEVSSEAGEGSNTVVSIADAGFYNSAPKPFPITILPGTVHFTSAMAIGATTGRESYGPGENVRISALAFNPYKSPRDVDVYFALHFPNGTLRVLPSLSTDLSAGRIPITLASDTSIPETVSYTHLRAHET